LGIGIAGAAAIVSVKSIEMAADFETAMTKLQTDAGETAQQLPGLADGFKTLATQVGYTATELATADWHVASSGFHDVADNLKVMTAAAEGARVGGSDLEETTQALSRVMVAFHLPADQATGAMNALIESTSRGDARLEDMTQAMTNVLPAASAAGVGLDQVLGAMSTMTAQGEDAASAGTHLRATLLNLSGGTTEASKAMADYGIQADQVKATLQGGGGITGAFDMLTQKIGEGTQGFSGYLDQLRAAGDDTDKFDSILASMPAGMESPIGALE
jgi:TP901 family phage tail tape measure protein